MRSLQRSINSLLLTPALVVTLALSSVQSSEWAGGSGDWFEPLNWDNGVPDATIAGQVSSGMAHFSQPAEAAGLVVGGRVSPRGSTNGAVIGTADLSLSGDTIVGEMGGTGTDVRTGTGVVAINGGDLRIVSYEVTGPGRGGVVTTTVNPLLFIGKASGTGNNNHLTGEGTVSINNGSVITEGSIRIGLSEGTGTNTTMASRGTLNITNGSLLAGGPVFIANSYRTSTGLRPSYGEVNVTSGDIRTGVLGIGFSYNTGAHDLAHGVVKLVDGDLQTDAIGIGTAGGSRNFAGNAYGELFVQNGNITTGDMTIGSRHLSENATGHGEGRVTLVDGHLTFDGLAVGTSVIPNRATASGILEIHRGIATGSGISVAETSRLVLGIEGKTPGTEHAQMQIDRAALQGVVEAKFESDYLPARGDVFDLIVANSITGNYTVEVTGIDVSAYPNFSIVRRSNLLRLSFIPEPGTYLQVAIAILFGSAQRIFSARRWSWDGSPTPHPPPLWPG